MGAKVGANKSQIRPSTSRPGTGGKIAFDVRGGEVVVSRVEAAHEDPAIGAFLSLLEADIRAGRNLRTLSPDLAEVLLVNASRTVHLGEDIEGEVEL